MPNLPFVGLQPPAIHPLVGSTIPFIGSKRFLGFTAIELLVTIVIASILVTLALPNLRVFVQNNRLKTEASEFAAALNYARTEAKSNAATVTVCVSTNGTACTGATWKLGWLVWGDANRNSVLNAAEVIRVRPAPDNGIVLTSTNDPAVTSFAFSADGSIVDELTFSVCDDTRSGEEGRNITVTPVGQVRVKPKTDCS